MSIRLVSPRPSAPRPPLARRTLTVLTAAALATAAAGPIASAATPTVTLMMSTSTARTSAVALAGAVVKGKVAIFTTNDSVVKTVRFYVDSATTPTRTEGYKPYDLAGTASDLSAYLWDTSSLAAGTHKVTASIDLLAGGTITTSSSFTVGSAVPVPPPAPAPVLPTAPTGLKATAGNAQVSLAWTAVTGATSYAVYRNGTSVLTTSSASAVSTGLTNGTAYSFAVTATSSTGTSPQSAAVSATPIAPAPAAPTGLAAAAGDTKVALTWTAPAGATAYRLYRNGSLVASPTAASFTDTALVNGTAYTYYVTAVAQNSPASPASGSVTATPLAPVTSANGLPIGNLPHWNQIFTEDFTTNAALGSFLSTYSGTWGAYPSPWKDTSGNGTYDPAATLSVSNGTMDIWVHTTSSGEHAVAAPTPKLPTMTYGRYSIRFQADPVPGYKTAWLLWPNDEVWPGHGEIDFPEGNLDQRISAFAHYASSSGGQDAFSTNATYTSWHTATTEWSPGKIVFILDGVVIGTSTHLVPSTPMHWVIQTETQIGGGAPASSASGHVRIDWVSAYTYVP